MGLLNTSLISVKLLDEVGFHSNANSVKYRVRLGDLALKADGHGEVTPHDDLRKAGARLDFDAGTLLMDLTSVDEKTGVRTEEDKQVSLRHQTRSGAVAQAYTRKVASLGGEHV